MFKVKVKLKGMPAVKKLSGEWKEGAYKGLRDAMFFFERHAKLRFGTPGNIKARTGNYRRNIASSVNFMGSRTLVGILHGNVSYAGVHEFGFKGVVNIPAHDRRIGKGMKQRSVLVRAHTRRMNIPARPVLTPAIEENMVRGAHIIKNRILKETTE